MNPLSHITNRFHLRRRIESARPRLYRLAWSWCHDQPTAEDLVQVTLLWALQNLEQLRDAKRLEVWLTRILINQHRDQLRRKRDDATFSERDLVHELAMSLRLKRWGILIDSRLNPPCAVFFVSSTEIFAP